MNRLALTRAKLEGYEGYWTSGVNIRTENEGKELGRKASFEGEGQ